MSVPIPGHTNQLEANACGLSDAKYHGSKNRDHYTWIKDGLGFEVTLLPSREHHAVREIERK